VSKTYCLNKFKLFDKAGYFEVKLQTIKAAAGNYLLDLIAGRLSRFLMNRTGGPFIDSSPDY
jgi:hypothetical protein